MAFFELWPSRSDANFTPAGGLGNNSLVPQLRLSVMKSETVAICAQPDGVKLNVKPANPAVVKIEHVHDPAPNMTVYKLTGLIQGDTVVEARFPAGRVPAGGLAVAGSHANLDVTVVDPNATVPSADFVAGFKEGFAASAAQAGHMVLDKISKDPNGFAQAVQIGCAKGLLEGLVSLLKALVEILKLGIAFSPVGMVVNTTRYVFDKTFRDEVDKHVAEAKKLADALSALVVDVSMNKDKFTAIFNVNGKAIGKIVGEEVGRELKAEIASKSAVEIGDFVGFIIGRVMFEVIFIVGTEGLGMAAGAAKVSGEGAGLAARLIPKLRQLLVPLRELEAFIKGRLGIKSVGKVVEVVEALKPYINLNPRAAAEEVALGKWLDELAQRGALGGDVGRVRGMPEGGGASPDFHFMSKGADAADAAAPGRRADGVIAEGSNINNIISNAIGSKAGRQAEIIVIELGARGTSGSVTDAGVTAWTAADVAPMSPSLQRLVVVRNTGGMRSIVLDMRVR
jgi:hypothetical protein